MSQHIGSSFDDFLQEEGIHEEVTTAVLERLRQQKESNEAGLCDMMPDCSGPSPSRDHDEA